MIAEDDGIIIGRADLPIVNRGDALFHVARMKKSDLVQQPLFDEDEIILIALPSPLVGEGGAPQRRERGHSGRQNKLPPLPAIAFRDVHLLPRGEKAK